MSIQSPKLLFIPVSSPEGIGEYMRSMIIADAVKQKWPDAQIRFVLNRHAPYAKDCHHQVDLLDDTPTKCVRSVNDIISVFRPDIVIFDASGRQSQLAHAKKVGAKVIFLSQHKRKRSRGMKVGRAKHTDLHWVVQPEFVIGKISRLDKWKLSLINKPEPVNIGPVFSQPMDILGEQLLRDYGLVKGAFILFNAGSGGHCIDEGLAADVFFESAKRCCVQTGLVSVVVFGANYPKVLPSHDKVKVLSNLSNERFITLLSLSKLAVLSGGDTLLQAIAIKKPSVIVPVSKDQPQRIAMCAKERLIFNCEANSQSMTQQVQSLLDGQAYNSLQERINAMPQLNGLKLAIDGIETLLNKE